MCGKYSQTSPLQKLKEIFGIGNDISFDPPGIVTPARKAAIITSEMHFSICLWGFIPRWQTDVKPKIIVNARLETLHEKPSFKNARRCLIPADSYFETGDDDTRYQLSMPDNAPFLFAGIADTWVHPQTGESTDTFALITQEADDARRHIHPRMPVIFENRDAALHWAQTPAYQPRQVLHSNLHIVRLNIPHSKHDTNQLQLF